MNGKVSKALRSLFNPREGNEISKKAYRIAKKNYKQLNQQEKKDFIKNLETVQNSNK